MSLSCPVHSTDMRMVSGVFGPYYVCDTGSCEMRVGARRDGTPKGTPADAATRSARIAAHQAFDPLWRDDSNGWGRGWWYRWLARKMELHPDDCHMALFDADQCQRVVKICADYLTTDDPEPAKGSTD